MLLIRVLLLLAIAAAGLGAPATSRAALPDVLDMGMFTPTPSGFIDSEFQDGDDGTVGTPLIWSPCPAINLLSNASTSINLRTWCPLQEPGGPDATLSLFSGALPAGITLGTDGFSVSSPTVGTASVVVKATRGLVESLSSAIAITVTAPPVGDSAPPTPVRRLSSSDHADGTGSLSWLPSSDPNVSGTVTGVASYQVKLGGSAIATVTAPSANIQPALTQTIIGSSDGTPSSTQSNADWALSFGGAGLLSTTDNYLMRAATITGDFTAILKVTAFSSSSGTAGSIGIASRASDANDAIAVHSRWRDTDDKCNQRFRTSTAGAASNGSLSAGTYSVGSLWIIQERLGDVFTTSCSSDGNTFTTTSSQTVSPGQSVLVGPFITCGNAGVANCTGTAAEFSIVQAGSVSYQYTGAGGTFTVNSYDGTNRASDSTAVTLAPTGGSGGGGGDATIPPVTNTCGVGGSSPCTVCTAGCTYTPADLETTAIAGLDPGDVLELRTATAGGTERWATRIVCRDVDGTSADPIWIVVRDGDSITLEKATGKHVGLIDLYSCSYLNIVGSRDGGTSGLVVGDVTYHQLSCLHSSEAGPYGCYPHGRSILIQDNPTDPAAGLTASSAADPTVGVAIYGATILGANNHDASATAETASRILLKNVEISRDGTNALETAGGGAPASDAKDILHFCSARSALINVYSHHSGHATPIPCGPYQVWRNLDFDGNWLDLTNYPQYTGNHAAIFLPGANRPDYNTVTRFGPLIEDSAFWGAGTEPEHRVFQESVQFLGRNIIFRRNFLVQRAGANSWERMTPQAMAHCATATANDGTPRHERLQYYNNTVYGGFVGNTSASIGGSTTGHPADMCSRYNVFNNLFQGQQTGSKRGVNGADAADDYTVRWQTPAAHTGYANAWKGARWFANVFGKHATDPAADAFFRVQVLGAGGGTGIQNLDNGTDANGDWDCADAGDSGAWPANWCGNRVAALPFTGNTTAPVTNGPTDQSIDRATIRSLLTLHASSPIGLGDAWPITTTTDAGTADTTLTLGDAGPFFDGWDFDAYDWGGLHVERPDCIAVGPTASSTPAQAVLTAIVADSINYSTGTVTVSPGVTHVAGSPVWPATRDSDGNCVAIMDNRGAAQ